MSKVSDTDPNTKQNQSELSTALGRRHWCECKRSHCKESRPVFRGGRKGSTW